MDACKNESVRSELIKHLEDKVLPEYELNDKGHGIDHAEYVIRRSIAFGKQACCDIEMCITCAAYHDIMHHVDKNNHETLGGQRLYEDQKLREFFSEEQMVIMKEAVEDHRSSLKGEPRSIYGRVLSSADRSTDYRTAIKRSYYHNRKHNNELGFYETMQKVKDYIEGKYGVKGTVKMYFDDPDFEQMRKKLQELLDDDKNFYLEFVSIISPIRRDEG